MRMAAREHHPQLAVLDLGIEKVLFNPFVLHRASGDPRSQHTFTNLVAPQNIENLVLGNAVHPARRIVGHAAHVPGFQGVQERRLHHVLDELEMPPAEDAHEHGHQAAGRMAEEMFDEWGDGFRCTHVMAPWSAQVAPSMKPSDSTPKPRLKRARKFSQAMTASCCGLRCSRKLLNNSSAT